jgi:hypothetical protein
MNCHRRPPMPIEFIRQAGSTDIFIRVTQDLIVHYGVDQYGEEMRKAIREFVQTDSEVRTLINEMVRTAFGQVDLLKLVTETIQQTLIEAARPKVAPTEEAAKPKVTPIEEAAKPKVAPIEEASNANV